MSIPLPVLPNVYRVAFIWGGVSGAPNPVNVMHIQATATGTTPTMLYNAIAAAVGTNMWASVQSGSRIITVSILPLDGISSAQTFSPPATAAWTGSGGSGVMPQVCGLIKITTGHRGRNYRGRLYLPLTSESAANTGILSGTTTTAMQPAWNNFVTSLGLATPTPFQFGMAAYDRAHSGAGAHFAAATAVTVETYTATQRRRQPGRKVARHRRHI